MSAIKRHSPDRHDPRTCPQRLSGRCEDGLSGTTERIRRIEHHRAPGAGDEVDRQSAVNDQSYDIELVGCVRFRGNVFRHRVDRLGRLIMEHLRRPFDALRVRFDTTVRQPTKNVALHVAKPLRRRAGVRSGGRARL